MLHVARIMLHHVGGWKSLPPQGNDRGTQYRSAIVVYTPEQEELAECSLCSTVRIHTYSRSTRSHASAPPFKCAHARRQTDTLRPHCRLTLSAFSCPLPRLPFLPLLRPLLALQNAGQDVDYWVVRNSWGTYW